MVDIAITYIRDELRNYFTPEGGGPPADVNIGNVGLLDTERADNNLPQGGIIITLVNIEEESTLKNTQNIRRTTEGISYIEPPVFLNFYLLFSCVSGNYTTAMNHLSGIIRFFQSRKQFGPHNSTSIEQDEFSTLGSTLFRLKLTFELYTLTFEQINHVWGALGGRQVPSVMYKGRILSVSENDLQREAPLIEEIQKRQYAQ